MIPWDTKSPLVVRKDCLNYSSTNQASLSEIEKPKEIDMYPENQTSTEAKQQNYIFTFLTDPV